MAEGNCYCIKSTIQIVMKRFFKFLKNELFFVKKMIQYRYGLGKWKRYINNKFFLLRLLRGMKPISCKKQDDFEVHILTPKSGLWMTYWTIRSFMYHSKLCPRVVVHDDGTIDEKTAQIFESKFSNVKVLRRAEADSIFNNSPSIPDIIKRHRKSTNVLILMFLDHLFLSMSRRVLVLDNDILFYDRPTEIIDFVEGRSNMDAIYAVYGDGKNPLDVSEAYQKKHPDILDDAARLNSGIMVFDKSKIDIDWVVEYFEHTTKPNGHLIEQTGWGMVLAQISHAFFPEDKYKLRGAVEFPAVAKHFTNPRRHEMFAYGIDEARERIKYD
ncbi:MAG: hypothetical protein ABH833_03565 [Parcubacteria group bacterium]